MLTCEGYKMFYGTMVVCPMDGKPQHIRGTWLYKPDVETWYCGGWSYPERVCTVYDDETVIQ